MTKILYLLGFYSHENFMHFSAHFGMSFTLYIILDRITKYPGSLTFLIGLVYKLSEGINYNVPNDFMISMIRDFLGILIARRIKQTSGN